MTMTQCKLVRWLVGAVFMGGLAIGLASCSKTETIDLRIIHTTDVHGALFAYDYIGERSTEGGMARLSSMMKELRASDSNILLLDGGDMLQGEPITYYSNYIDTLSTNAVSEAMNFVGYDAATMGNHDIEPGHRVYDRFVDEVGFPILAANAVRTEDGTPYFKPYTVIERGGARVAVLGLITPAIPQWLPQHLWEGMRFEDVVESAKTWVPRIVQDEHPDMLIALVHSGLDNDNTDYNENAGRQLAETVSGIDLVLIGHDHRQTVEWVQRPSSGDSVLVLNPANRLERVGDIQVHLERKGGKVVSRRIEGKLTELASYEPDTAYLDKMSVYDKGVRAFLGRRIGVLDAPVEARDALFGSSAYMDVVHQMQLATVGAEVSFAAPLSLGARLQAGDIFVRDLFKWCPFSNHLYAMELTGREIKGYLEHSYGGWARQMKTKDEGLIAMRPDAKPTDRYKTLVPTFNYSSAQGIDYIVDVSKPAGERITILQMSNGEPFDMERTYRCAINSYRAGGAGGMLTTGAGIAKADLPGRIRQSSEYDQFFSLMRYFEIKGVISPKATGNWRFVPAAWVSGAEERDRAFLWPKQ